MINQACINVQMDYIQIQDQADVRVNKHTIHQNQNIINVQEDSFQIQDYQVVQRPLIQIPLQTLL